MYEHLQETDVELVDFKIDKVTTNDLFLIDASPTTESKTSLSSWKKLENTSTYVKSKTQI